MKPPSDEVAIRRVLERFQDGYTGRDVTGVAAYVEELFAEDVHVIGTGPDEWCDGIVAVKDLVRSDWETWGDLELDLDRAVVRVRDDVAWVGVAGTLTQASECYPIRLAAGLSRRGGTWRFHQMVFSYPHPRNPVPRHAR